MRSTQTPRADKYKPPEFDCDLRGFDSLRVVIYVFICVRGEIKPGPATRTRWFIVWLQLLRVRGVGARSVRRGVRVLGRDVRILLDAIIGTVRSRTHRVSRQNTPAAPVFLEMVSEDDRIPFFRSCNDVYSFYFRRHVSSSKITTIFANGPIFPLANVTPCSEPVP